MQMLQPCAATQPESVHRSHLWKFSDESTYLRFNLDKLQHIHNPCHGTSGVFHPLLRHCFCPRFLSGLTAILEEINPCHPNPPNPC